MEPSSSQFKWTNFDFNMEIHIAGDFLYEGIYLIDRLSRRMVKNLCLRNKNYTFAV